MKLIDQHTKRIMEGCKVRAAEAGLKFDKETLEYMVTNSDLIELSPKNMIPTLYDYWVQDIQVLRGKGEYDYYPNNPYETVINTRPVISFYNNNNPDWLNVMIFYHVIAHIDFFQNNKFFEQTWNYDFKEKALTDKRIIEKLRSTKKRQVDYIIEFARGIDNLVGFYDSNFEEGFERHLSFPDKIDFYFNVFLQKVKGIPMNEFLDEVERYNQFTDTPEKSQEEAFLSSIKQKYPEFDNHFQIEAEKIPVTNDDLMQFIMNESSFLKQEKNKWMKMVIEIIRDTALYFSPMIRTKTMNEGWASYWHEKLFLADDRIKGHEIAFAKINAMVTSLSKVGLNPYAIGWRLFMHIEEMANKGRLTYEYEKTLNSEARKKYEKKGLNGKDFIFYLRENYCDFTFFNRFIEQDFVDKYNLMVVGSRVNQRKNVREYYVKSRKAKDYKAMLFDNLYHPPFMKFEEKADKTLYLNHEFEGQELYRDYVPNTMLGLEYLWGGMVQLETSEVDIDKMRKESNGKDDLDREPIFRRVVYTMKDKKLKKEVLDKD